MLFVLLTKNALHQIIVVVLVDGMVITVYQVITYLFSIL